MLDNGKVYLRALEPTDIDVIHRWENDCDLWRFGCATLRSRASDLGIS